MAINVTDIKNGITGILESLKSDSAQSADDKKDSEAILRLALEELHIVHRSVSAGFDNLRTKALNLMGGEVLIVTLLLSWASNHDPFKDKPILAYSVIFFSLGVLMLVLAFIMLLSVISSVKWVYPPEEQDIVNIHERFGSDTIKFLNYLREEYIAAINRCVETNNRKSRDFMRGMYLLVAGVFIVIVILFGSSILKI